MRPRRSRSIATVFVLSVAFMAMATALVQASTPAISNVTVTNVLTTSATVNWTTDTPSNSQVEYGTTTAYGSATTLDSTMVTAHNQALSSLQMNTLVQLQSEEPRRGWRPGRIWQPQLHYGPGQLE